MGANVINVTAINCNNKTFWKDWFDIKILKIDIFYGIKKYKTEIFINAQDKDT